VCVLGAEGLWQLCVACGSGGGGMQGAGVGAQKVDCVCLGWLGAAGYRRNNSERSANCIILATSSAMHHDRWGSTPRRQPR
jgi:hypothetical protein